ncbi:MAG: GNAT family N-acetyltransferase [Proteobacteria bacterium]|nr:GNAT family N-acetyltransferase [Pseudomonadota bacterium]
MKTIIYEDPDVCRFLWEKMWPQKGLFDLWEVRSCFHNRFSRPLSFHSLENNNMPIGLLALSYDEDAQRYVQFPGETWHGKTWLEQNRIIAPTREILEMLVDSVPGSVHLNYLTPDVLSVSNGMAASDETGYLFYPGEYGFSYESYLQSFTGKFRKKIRAELSRLEDQQMVFQFDQMGDIVTLFQMNLDAFGTNSYFSDSRFLSAFESLVAYLHQRGMLKITTISVNGKTAAVDIGAVYNKTYTLLAGGTNPEFPGVAKGMNLHHMEWSCRHHMESVDFLCGDFNWKERFHLIPRPLYKLHCDKSAYGYNKTAFERVLACA